MHYEPTTGLCDEDIDELVGRIGEVLESRGQSLLGYRLGLRQQVKLTLILARHNISQALAADNDKTIFADAVTPDDAAYTAWDAKHTSGGPNAMHEGKSGEFIMQTKFDRQMMTYRDIINSESNPITRLVVVTNTPKAQAHLHKRLLSSLGPDTPFEVRFIP